MQHSLGLLDEQAQQRGDGGRAHGVGVHQLANKAHEEMDAVNITFPAAQWALVQAVAAAAAKPITVVIMTAVPLDISEVLALENVGAVIHAGQPSVQTLGIGDVIFGEKVPAGRLIQTVYPEAYAAEVSIFGASSWLARQAAA